MIRVAKMQCRLHCNGKSKSVKSGCADVRQNQGGTKLMLLTGSASIAVTFAIARAVTEQREIGSRKRNTFTNTLGRSSTEALLKHYYLRFNFKKNRKSTVPVDNIRKLVCEPEPVCGGELSGHGSVQSEPETYMREMHWLPSRQASLGFNVNTTNQASEHK